MFPRPLQVKPAVITFALAEVADERLVGGHESDSLFARRQQRIFVNPVVNPLEAASRIEQPEAAQFRRLAGSAVDDLAAVVVVDVGAIAHLGLACQREPWNVDQDVLDTGKCFRVEPHQFRGHGLIADRLA